MRFSRGFAHRYLLFITHRILLISRLNYFDLIPFLMIFKG
jgi:hypothetical protein